MLKTTVYSFLLFCCLGRLSSWCAWVYSDVALSTGFFWSPWPLWPRWHVWNGQWLHVYLALWDFCDSSRIRYSSSLDDVSRPKSDLSSLNHQYSITSLLLHTVKQSHKTIQGFQERRDWFPCSKEGRCHITYYMEVILEDVLEFGSNIPNRWQKGASSFVFSAGI